MNPNQIASLIGAALILISFMKVTAQKWDPRSKSALGANALGGAILTVTAILERQYGFIVLEVVWTGVSVWGLLKKG
jgi:hypothetical protein